MLFITMGKKAWKKAAEMLLSLVSVCAVATTVSLLLLICQQS